MIVQHYVNLWWVGGLEHDLARLIRATPGWEHRIIVRGSVEPEALKLLEPFDIRPEPFAAAGWRIPAEVDAVVYHNQPASAASARQNGRPTIAVYHGYPVQKAPYAAGTLHCAVNREGTAWLAGRQGIPDLPSLHPGIEPPPIHKISTERGYTLADPIRVGCIASGRAEKFHPRLLVALEAIAKQRSIVFCGYGMAPLADYFRNCPCPYELLPPAVGPGKWEFLAGLDIGLYLPQCQEGFGIGVQEMLAVGLPIVTNGRGGLADQITDGGNGLLAADPLSAAAATLRLIDNMGLRGNLGLTAARRVANSYGLDEFAARYAQAIELAGRFV